MMPPALTSLLWRLGAGLVLVAGGFVAGCQNATREAAQALAQCRADESTANRSLLVLVRAGNDAAQRGAESLRTAEANNQRARGQVAKLRQQIAGGAATTCANAATRVRLELAP